MYIFMAILTVMYVCDMQDTILFFGYNASKDALSRVVQMRGHDIMSGRYVVYPL